MDTLGLPLSFGTSKMVHVTIILQSKHSNFFMLQRENATHRHKRSTTKPKSAINEKERNKHHLDRCSDDSSISCCNIHLKWGTETLQNSVLAEFPLHPLGDHHDNFHYGEPGVWKVIWNPFYKDNYVFNVQALQPTWFPPLGFEKYTFACSNLSRKETQEGAFSFPETSTTSSTVLDTSENVAINKKMTVRKSQSGKLQTRCPSDSLLKYWRQRYSLFSRFDNGIKMDEESWFSVTPEEIAMHHAFRCGAGTIIDCFTGVGGNAIQFAMRSNHVIAIDVDPQKIDFAQHNAFIYGVSERIDFIKGDFFKIAPSLKGDVAFLAPPWGGPDYAKKRTYDISLLKPRKGQYLFKIASMIADKVVMFLPRNVNLEQLADLSLSADPPWKLEVEKNHLNGWVKSITAYFDRTMS